MSRTSQAVTRSLSFTGFGKSPAATFRHKVAWLNGMIAGISCAWRTKPTSGRVWLDTACLDMVRREM